MCVDAIAEFWSNVKPLLGLGGMTALAGLLILMQRWQSRWQALSRLHYHMEFLQNTLSDLENRQEGDESDHETAGRRSELLKSLRVSIVIIIMAVASLSSRVATPAGKQTVATP